MQNKLLMHPFGRALLTVLYIGAVVLLISQLDKIVGEGESPWFPVIGLTLFVLSAATTGGLVLGRPLMLYLDGKKGEAVQFFVQTLGWLFGLFILVLLLVAFIR